MVTHFVWGEGDGSSTLPIQTRGRGKISVSLSPRRLMARISPFQGGEEGSKPSGGTLYGSKKFTVIIHITQRRR